MESQEKKLCDYGCGQEAIVFFKNGVKACSRYNTQCPVKSKKMQEKRKETMHSIGEDGLSTFQRISIKNAKVRGEEGYKKSAEKMKETKRSDVDETGLDCYQRTALKTAETRKNDLDQTGLDSYARGGMKAKETGFQNNSYTLAIEKKRNDIINGLDAIERAKDAYKQTCIDLYGDDYYKFFQKILRNNLLSTYSVVNVFQLDEVKEKSKHTCLKIYGVEIASQSKEVQSKARKTRIKNGYETPHELKDPFVAYKQQVNEATRESWKIHFDKINPDRIIRSSEFHLDHIFSIFEGFINNVDPLIIGHWTNLQILHHSANESKSIRSDKTKEELYEDYRKALLLESDN